MIETERLILREWTLNDLDDLVEGLNNFETAKNLTVPFPYTKEDGINFITRHLKNENGNYYFAVVLKNSGKVIGGTNISIDEESGENSGGIWINENYTGIGLGTEVWVARAKFAFEELKLKNLTNGFYDFNERSRHMQLKVGGKIVGEKINFCPALNCEVREIRTNLSKEAFYDYLKDN